MVRVDRRNRSPRCSATSGAGLLVRSSRSSAGSTWPRRGWLTCRGRRPHLTTTPANPPPGCSRRHRRRIVDRPRHEQVVARALPVLEVEARCRRRHRRSWPMPGSPSTRAAAAGAACACSAAAAGVRCGADVAAGARRPDRGRRPALPRLDADDGGAADAGASGWPGRRSRSPLTPRRVAVVCATWPTCSRPVTPWPPAPRWCPPTSPA